MSFFLAVETVIAIISSLFKYIIFLSRLHLILQEACYHYHSMLSANKVVQCGTAPAKAWCYIFFDLNFYSLQFSIIFLISLPLKNPNNSKPRRAIVELFSACFIEFYLDQQVQTFFFGCHYPSFCTFLHQASHPNLFISADTIN